MDWHKESVSIHHRTECSNDDYLNINGDLQARGGYLGDFQFKTRYLFRNTGKGAGSRIFFEGGIREVCRAMQISVVGSEVPSVFIVFCVLWNNLRRFRDGSNQL